ncbi:Peptidase family M48 [Duganella sp. CF402]|uniref:M48 family metalloprotease n=1 Tax=unclassified Duganella TaxID=2636909 RepID=UPI0008C12CD8|nr:MULTISPECIES: M48 family metalloprotease [unclassified Duganella]RZT04370.1 peptidase M48-like protein [Duganella sp. BK701]SEM38693.1 Peptidase family M48 [Duganella sp. CF402]
MARTLSRFAALLLATLLAALLAAPPAPAATPTADEVVARAAVLYADRLADHIIDRDQYFTTRVRRIADRLVAQAQRDYPETAGWAWEVHTTDDGDITADCMAGGKILVSKPYVERLQLNDDELAMLLAHEIEHAALHHNLKEYQAALRIDAVWEQRSFLELEHAVDHDRTLMGKLAATNYAQEEEADREGLRLAWRAGWPAERLAGYFRKMMRASDWPRLSKADYPSPAQRWRAAQAVAADLQKK